MGACWPSSGPTGRNRRLRPDTGTYLANEVSDDPRLQKQIGGSGPGRIGFGMGRETLSWVSTVRCMIRRWALGAPNGSTTTCGRSPRSVIKGALGQSSDSSDLATYHPDGLPLESDLIEVITATSIGPGGKHRNAYENANRIADGTFLPDLLLHRGRDGWQDCRVELEP